MLALGTPPIEAIGTIRVGSLGLVLGSFAETKSKGLICKDYFKPLLIGGLLGIRFAIKQGNEFVKRAMAIMSILLVLGLFI